MPIRQFQPSDAVACFELISACIEQDLNTSESLRADLFQLETPDSIRERAGLYYLAVWELGNEITGVGGVEINEIRLLFVAPEHQSSGHGTELLKHLEGMVPPALCTEILVHSTLSAEPFYRRHGYKPVGRNSFRLAHSVLETILMSKAIARSPAPGLTG